MEMVHKVTIGYILETDLIREISVQMNSKNEVKLKDVLTELESKGYSFDQVEISFYSDDYEEYVLVTHPNTCLIPTMSGTTHVHLKMSYDKEASDGNGSESKVEETKAKKQETIELVMNKVKVWELLYKRSADREGNNSL